MVHLCQIFHHTALLLICRSSGEVHVASAAKTPDPSDPAKTVPATTVQIVAPYDVEVGAGIIHNINGLLLPMTNLTRLAHVARCH